MQSLYHLLLTGHDLTLILLLALTPAAVVYILWDAMRDTKPNQQPEDPQ